jgi:transcriptional regulator with XRE-family HTH domain
MPGRKKRIVASDTFSYRVGRRIQARREAMGLSIREAARRTGGEISDNLFGLYEDGTDPGFRKMLLVCVALEATLDDLLPDDVKAALTPGLEREERLARAALALANRGPLPPLMPDERPAMPDGVPAKASDIPVPPLSRPQPSASARSAAGANGTRKTR